MEGDSGVCIEPSSGWSRVESANFLDLIAARLNSALTADGVEFRTPKAEIVVPLPAVLACFSSPIIRPWSPAGHQRTAAATFPRLIAVFSRNGVAALVAAFVPHPIRGEQHSPDAGFPPAEINRFD